MAAAGERFKQLLQQEKDAARRADVNALAELQAEKERCLQALHDADLPDAERAEINALAGRNVDLMRHLVGCLRAMVQPQGEPTYDASGARADEALRGRVVRGAL